MIIHLNENRFNKLFLTEDKRGEQAKALSLQVIRDFFPWWRTIDEPFNHPDNPDGLSNLNYMFKCFEEVFFHDPKLRASQIMRLEPAFVKMAFDAGFQQGHNDAKRLNRIRKIIWRMYHAAKSSEAEAKFISKIPINVSFDELDEKYGKQIDIENAEETDRINNTEYPKEIGDYTIVGPLDFEEAHKFAEMSGDMEHDSTKMCYGMFRGTWDDYTNNGNYHVYVAMKNGWENIPPEHDNVDKSGYDTYGLSLIFVIVDEDGDLAYCNTRWNHAARYKPGRSVDNALTREEISNIIGANFMKIFK